MGAATPIEIHHKPISTLIRYAQISIAFKVTHILDVTPQRDGSSGWQLFERRLDASYVKDYDAIDGNNPTQWPQRFDVSNWALLEATSNSQQVGGAVIAFNTPGLDMLENRTDLAVLWDIRVASQFRGQGIGSALFRAAETWAVARGCRQLKAETQSVNVPACRFYARQGCTLQSVNPAAYPQFLDEVQLLWYKDIAEDNAQSRTAPQAAS